MAAFDTLTRFVFENAAVRGELIHLDESWREVLARAEYPIYLQTLLGELTAAAGLLIATLKYEGNLTLQMQGNNAVRLLVVEITSSLHVRAMAKWDTDASETAFSNLMNDGQLVITLTPATESHRSYQGIVPLIGGSVAEALMHYMTQSEQIDSLIVLAADEQCAAGMLLQRLPDRPDGDADTWARASHLGATLKAEELLSLDTGLILHRLFHEEDLRVFEPEPVEFACTCSRLRVAEMLKMLGQEEVESVLEEQGLIEVQCEFCGKLYHFDAIDSTQLWLSNSVAPVNTKH
jgi:molecular chaperone Hsp33